MKAIVATRYGSPQVLQVQGLEKPTPKDNEVLIKIHASAVVATDPAFRQGDLITRVFNGMTKPKHAIPGDVLAGEIESVGKEVTRFKTGERVYAACAATQGGQAEYICMPQDGPLAVMPANMSFVQAVGVPDGALGALNFLRDAGKLQRGQKVLINGASGAVGTYAVQLAKYFGAHVTAVCSAANVELVKSLGADNVIDYTKEDFTQRGDTFDLIFDAVGKSSFSRCKNLLNETGTYVTSVPAPDFLIQLLWTRNSRGKKARFVAPGLRSSAQKAQDLAFLTQLIEAGALKSVVDRCYPMEQIRDAHRYVETGHKKGSVVIVAV